MSANNMLQTIKILASSIAAIIAIVAYIPYLIDMFRGKNQPHLYTWISIFLITSVVAYIQLIGGAGIGAIPTIIGAFIDGIILFFCFRFGTKDIIFIDKICLAISIIGIATYLFLSSQPILALIVVTFAEIISFIPTFRKTKNNPYSESLTSYYLLVAKLALILVALEQYNILTTSYSILWLFIILAFIITTLIWREKKSTKTT